MNVFREVRKARKKSLAFRIRIILIFGIILIANTYAWFSINKKIELSQIELETNAWDVAYVINGTEVLSEDIKFDLENIYPGTDYKNDFTHVYNSTEFNSKIKIEITRINIFAEEININELIRNGRIIVTENGKCIKIFEGDEEYPFVITCQLDKTELSGKYQYGEYINGKYVDKKDEIGKFGYENNSESVATLNIGLEWKYNGNKDEMDTEIGKKAYEYYKTVENEDEITAIKIEIKLNSEYEP